MSEQQPLLGSYTEAAASPLARRASRAPLELAPLHVPASLRRSSRGSNGGVRAGRCAYYCEQIPQCRICLVSKAGNAPWVGPAQLQSTPRGPWNRRTWATCATWPAPRCPKRGCATTAGGRRRGSPCNAVPLHRHAAVGPSVMHSAVRRAAALKEPIHSAQPTRPAGEVQWCLVCLRGHTLPGSIHTAEIAATSTRGCALTRPIVAPLPPGG